MFAKIFLRISGQNLDVVCFQNAHSQAYPSQLSCPAFFGCVVACLDITLQMWTALPEMETCLKMTLYPKITFLYKKLWT